MKIDRKSSLVTGAIVVIFLSLTSGLVYSLFFAPRKEVPVNSPASVSKSGKSAPGNVIANVDFDPYMADLQRRIKRSWHPPKSAESKVVMVIFKVHRDGSMTDLRLSQPSGMAIADQAALEAIDVASPFRPLPKGAPVDVDIQFTFHYNVFKGNMP